MKELVELLRTQSLTIGSCESLTAGLFTSKLAEVPGASAVLKGGIVTYQTVIKEQVVHVEKEIIEQYGVVSEQTAKSMAEHARKLLDCDLCVSFTGNAGPDVMENKPAGRVFCALADKDNTYIYMFDLQGQRNEIREDVVMKMCEIIKTHIKNMK